MYCLFEKTENKRKIGRGWPIFNKDGSLLFFRVLTFIVTNLSLIQWTIADQFYFGPVVINLKPCWNFELHSFVIMTRWNKNLNCLNFLRKSGANFKILMKPNPFQIIVRTSRYSEAVQPDPTTTSSSFPAALILRDQQCVGLDPVARSSEINLAFYPSW